tara:strand:+ start:173 stop:385 length:213 start_codon:yes stop_codon:yes gene_type:complete
MSVYLVAIQNHLDRVRFRTDYKNEIVKEKSLKELNVQLAIFIRDNLAEMPISYIKSRKSLSASELSFSKI